jgi:hypothetical protein
LVPGAQAGDTGTSPQGGAAVSAVASPAALPRFSGEIVISRLDNVQNLPAIAYNWKHMEYLVVWHNTWGASRDIYAQRVTITGELKSWFDVTAGLPSNDKAHPSVAYDPVNDQYLVVWIYDKPGDGSNWDLRGRFVTWNGSNLLPEFTISDWGTQQWTPKVVYADTAKEFLVVWENWYQTPVLPSYVSGQIVTPSGGLGNNLTINHPTDPRTNPDVAYNHKRNEYLVVYDNDDGVSVGDIFGTRYNAGLTALAGGEFGIATWTDREIFPAVAACASADQYLVAWQSLRGGDFDLFAYSVKGDGSLDTVQPISELAGHQEAADVACDVSDRLYMLAWRESDAVPNPNAGISGRLVSPDGTLHQGFQIVAPGPPQGHDAPAVEGGHANYLVAWEHVRSGTAFRDIHGKLITPHAAFLPIVLRNK